MGAHLYFAFATGTGSRTPWPGLAAMTTSPPSSAPCPTRERGREPRRRAGARAPVEVLHENWYGKKFGTVGFKLWPKDGRFERNHSPPGRSVAAPQRSATGTQARRVFRQPDRGRDPDATDTAGVRRNVHGSNHSDLSQVRFRPLLPGGKSPSCRHHRNTAEGTAPDRTSARRGPHRTLDYEALAVEIGAVDVFINTVPWNMPSNAFIEPLRQRVAPTTSIGFPSDGVYEVVVKRDVQHSADLIFKLARLFDPSARIENYAQPLPASASTQEKARSIRAATPPGASIPSVIAGLAQLHDA